MKVLIIFIASLTMSLAAFASKSEMQKIVESGGMYSEEFNKNYTAKYIKSVKIQGELKSFLIETTKKKEKSWKKYVMTSGEYDHVSLAERRKIAANPLAELQVKYLLEIEDVYAIYKNGKLIGYSVEILDHVQMAYYQDGAWYDMLLDADLNIVEVIEQSA